MKGTASGFLCQFAIKVNLSFSITVDNLVDAEYGARLATILASPASDALTFSRRYHPMRQAPAATSVTQNSRILIVTAVITAVTTIGVAFIGIFPQLRNSDAKRYDQLQQDFAEFRQKSANVSASKSPEKTMSVS